MASVLQHVAWEPCLVEPRTDRELERYARSRLGVPQPYIKYFAEVPWLARAIVDLQPELGLLVHLDLHVASLVSLVVSQENSCRFCYSAVRAMLRIQGMSDERIERVEQDLTRTDLGERAAAALAFARAQSRTGPAAAPGARKALREAGVGEDELKELAFVVASSDFMNRASTIPAVPPYGMERLPDTLRVRLLRPLINRILTRYHVQGRPTPLDRTPTHPYAGLVQAFAGWSPIAPALARTLEDMFASPHLTRRCKLLLFAVIARGLGCRVCETEATGALRADGLGEAALTQVLTHLDAPELTPVERLLVPFARETIWYEPAPLQRRARPLHDMLTAPQFMEAIGVLSLANGLCRMGALVADHP